MPIASRAAAATNQPMPAALVWKSMPRGDGGDDQRGELQSGDREGDH
jgi:hypothetical protein